MLCQHAHARCVPARPRTRAQVSDEADDAAEAANNAATAADNAAAGPERVSYGVVASNQQAFEVSRLFSAMLQLINNR